MHAGTVVANDGLRHEGGGFTVLVSHVVDHVFLDLGPVTALGQRGELGADFALACGGDFMVVYFNRHAHFFQGQTHGAADVMQAVDRRDREIAALDARTVAGIAGFGLLAGRPCTFFRVDLDVAARHAVMPGDGIKDEEFGFRTKVGGVTNARSLQISLGALGDRTRVTVIALAGVGFDNVTGQQQGGFVKERVNVGRIRIRHQQHV